MLYWLLYPLASKIPAFNVFRYITFRTAMAAVTALVISFVLGPAMIRVRSVSRSASRSAPRAPRRITSRPGRRRWAAC